MSVERYSLCIPYINYVDGKVDKYIWRIADFDSENNRFTKAIYSDREESVSIEEFHPKKIRAKPFDLNPYKIEFRRWQALQGDNGLYTESERLATTPIEIIFYAGIDLEKHNSDSDIRTVLHNGISLLEYIGEHFLLAVNKTSTHYEALFCSKKDFSSVSGKFRIEKSCQDMLRTRHSFDLYSISKDDVIDTSDLNIYFSQDEKVPVRYFYSYLEVERLERKIFLRNPEDYAKAYISKYLKNKTDVFKITKSDARKMVGIVDDALRNREEFEVFFKETGFKFSDVEYALRNLADDVQEMYLQSDNFSQVVERSLLKDPVVLEKCIEEAKKVWLAENDEQRKELEQSLQSRQSELEELRRSCEHLLSDIAKNKLIKEKVQSEKDAIEQEYKNTDAKLEQIKKDIGSELEHFQNDIVHLAAISALSSGNSSPVSVNGSPQPIYLSGDPVLNDDSVTADNVKEFTDDLQVNLMIYGMNQDYAYGFSQFVVSSIACRKHFIVCGSKSEDVANSLSLLLQSKYADQIFLPSGFTDISSLISEINSMDGRIIILHNALETYSESIFLAVVKMCEEKIVLFSCEDETVYFNLPSHWGQYAAFLTPDTIWGMTKPDELLTGTFDYAIFFNTIIDLDSTKHLDILKPFESKGILKGAQIATISKMLVASQSIYAQYPNMMLAVFAHIHMLVAKHESLFVECLDELDISSDIKQIILREVCHER